MSQLGSSRFKMRLMTDEQLRRVLNEAGHYGRQPRDRARSKALFAVLATYGPRISEALLLRWQDVDFEKKTITLATLKQSKKDRATGIRHRVNASRTLPLFDEVAAWLLAYRKMAGPGDVLFPRTRRSAWRAFKTILGRAGIDARFRVHDIRHSVASRVASATRDPVIVRDLLGHSSIQISDVYLHAIDFREKLASVPPILPSPQDGASGGTAPMPGSKLPPAADGRDYLREAIQVLSPDAPRQHVFTHTGWHKIDGAWVYLTAKERLAGVKPPGVGQGNPPPPQGPQQALCIPPGYEHLALWFFPPLQADPVVWEAMRVGFLKHGPQDDKEFLTQTLVDMTEDARQKLPITPAGREDLRLAIATHRTCDELLAAKAEKLHTFIQVAHEALAGPGDPLAARVRELARRGADREWLEEQYGIAEKIWARYRQADFYLVGEELEGWRPLDALRGMREESSGG